MKLALTVFFISILAGCSFQIGIEYTGKTAKDHRDYSRDETKKSSWF